MIISAVKTKMQAGHSALAVTRLQGSSQPKLFGLV